MWIGEPPGTAPGCDGLMIEDQRTVPEEDGIKVSCEEELSREYWACLYDRSVRRMRGSSGGCTLEACLEETELL